MSKKDKPSFMGPMTQDQALSSFTPQGFYAPTGKLTWGNGGYNATLEDAYNPLNTLPQYNDIRTRLLGDIGLTGADRANQLDQYGQAFLDKSLEYSAPRLKALTYGRGQAGSRMAADSYADLVNKATTDSVLSRENLRNLDEQLKLQQLSTVEGGIGNAYNQYGNMIQQLLSGGQISESAAQAAMDQARQYVSDYNTLESERFQRSQQAPSWYAPVAMASNFIPYVGPAISAGMNAYGSTAYNNYPAASNLSSGLPSMTSLPSLASWIPGQAVPGFGGYGANTPAGVYNTGTMSTLPQLAL